jgi:cytochrome c peroxidase
VHADYKLLVACAGQSVVLELDGRSIDPMDTVLRRIATPAGPTAIAVDSDAPRALVLASFAHELAVVDLRGLNDTQRIALAQRDGSADAKWSRGRELFHSSDDPRISLDGRACASCHPDGRSDGLTWSTPDGPRQSIMLAGRVRQDQAFGWFGHNVGLEAHVGETFARLQGSGFATPRDRADLEALLHYVRRMPAPTPRSPRSPEQLALVARGSALFHDEAQGCGHCHPGGTADDLRHDVKSGDPIEASLKFDTPSLRFISGTAPYFHDGRFASMRELLESADAGMGHTRSLSERELRALEAYLETL